MAEVATEEKLRAALLQVADTWERMAQYEERTNTDLSPKI